VIGAQSVGPSKWTRGPVGEDSVQEGWSGSVADWRARQWCVSNIDLVPEDGRGVL
jgi:hypothetical protein